MTTPSSLVQLDGLGRRMLGVVRVWPRLLVVLLPTAFLGGTCDDPPSGNFVMEVSGGPIGPSVLDKVYSTGGQATCDPLEGVSIDLDHLDFNASSGLDPTHTFSFKVNDQKASIVDNVDLTDVYLSLDVQFYKDFGGNELDLPAGGLTLKSTGKAAPGTSLDARGKLGCAKSASDGGAPSTYTAPDASGIPPTALLDLSGPWSFSMDANQNNPAPAMSVLGSGPRSVTVSYNGGDGSQCDCNAEHLVIPLGKSFDCSSATLAFDYSATGLFGNTSTASLSVRFCNGKCATGGFYGGPQFLGSEQTGHSNCAIPFSNSFPAAPQLHEGRNVVPLKSLQSSLDGSCSGSFDTIDVHLQGYACFKDKDTATESLANLAVY